MDKITIKCEYAYDGNASHETYENRKTFPPEKWEITPVNDNSSYYIIAHNIDQDFKTKITIRKEIYEKIVLGYEQDIAAYLKTAYETWQGKKQ